MLKPTAVKMQMAPLRARQADHRKPSRGQAFAQSLSRFHLARCDEPAGKIVQAGIVPDHHKRADAGVDVTEDS